MIGISKYFEKKSASKPFVVGFFQVVFLSLVIGAWYVKSVKEPESLSRVFLFFVINSISVFVADYVFEKTGVNRKNFYYLPILFAVNYFLFIKTGDFHFVFNQILYLLAFFFIVSNQDEEGIKMIVFHLALAAVCLAFFIPQIIFTLLTIIVLILYHSAYPIRTIIIYLISIIMSFFFVYSLLFFWFKITDQIYFDVVMKFFQDLRVDFQIQWFFYPILFLIIAALFEVPAAIKKTNNFRKNFIYMSLITILLDVGMSLFLSEYSMSFSIVLVCFIYGNFIRFRHKFYLREILFSGSLLAMILLILLK